MGIRRWIDWKSGVWGTIAGVLFGLLIILVVSVMTSVNRTSASRPTSGSGTFDPGRTEGVGNVLVLTDSEAGLGIPEGVSTRGRVQLFLVAAHLANGDFQKAISVADAMDSDVDRDSGLQEIAEKLVPRELTTNPALLPKNNQGEREELIGNLRRLIQLADKATVQNLRARLLVRASIVKRSLDRENPGDVSPKEADLDPEALLSRVSGVIRTIPSDPRRSDTGMGIKILLTALLGLLGFAITQMIQPVLQAAGSVMAYEVSRKLHPALPDRLKGIHDDLTGVDHPRPDPSRDVRQDSSKRPTQG